MSVSGIPDVDGPCVLGGPQAAQAPDPFTFDVFADGEQVKVAHRYANSNSFITTPEIRVSANEVRIGCTVITLKAFEIIRQRWEEYRKAMIPPLIVQKREG